MIIHTRLFASSCCEDKVALFVCDAALGVAPVEAVLTVGVTGEVASCCTRATPVTPPDDAFEKSAVGMGSGCCGCCCC